MNTDLIARLRKQANMCASPTTWGEAADYIEQLESLRRDAERLDAFERMNREASPHTPYYENGAWRIPYLINGAGGLGGGVAEMVCATFRKAMDAAMSAEAIKTAVPVESADSSSGMSLSRDEFHDKAWALYQAKTFKDTQLAKVNIHTIRAVFNAVFDAAQSGINPKS